MLLSRQGSNLIVNNSSQPLFRICAEPGPWDLPADVQVGYPVLSDAGSSAYFQLLREWLRVCDNDHDCWNGPDSFLPSRLLDVEGENAGVPSLRLHISRQGERGRFLALSHCWGALEQRVKDRYCTYRCNVQSKMKEISWHDLPKTFQDAVTVARGLDIRYLWIDSMCIIQPHPGCSANCAGLQDWKSEAEKMEAYYSQAYVTIAATSACDSTTGFLHPRPAAEFVRAGTAPGGAPPYICPSIDNFRRDVVDGLLNRRAWVLQERALSHRTIHLTAVQAYWECGQGIRCETLTKLSNPRASFWSDPQFPNSILSHTKSNRFRLFQHLFVTYCNLGITYPTDRSHAVAGFLQRLAESISSNQHYGILDRFLHRSLLWKRRSNGAKLTRIDYPQDRAVPSWSWMAVHGEIGYMDVPSYRVECSDAIRSFPVNEDQRSEPDSGLQTHSSDPLDSGKAFRALSRTLTPSGAKNSGIA
ncbi:heterokaryon incompatibility protein-domain-containing protein [Xylaria scruposa]|nr:heterokaryon incompatibility protein-domain-containing protein [Xylaria scruposa]